MAETKQLHALSNIYLEAVYGGAKKEAPKDNRLTVTAADKKANTKAYQNYKAGNKAYKAADHLKSEGYQRDPEQQEKERKTSKQTDPSKDNFTGIGNSIKDIMKQNAAMKKAAAKKTKKEGFSNWRHDLKEIPDYEQIPVDAKKINTKVEEKKVKNIVKINPEMKEETQVDEGVYEKQKTKEVMGALKKRDLKKDVKKKIAADIVKKKGDTSKSDDRYAYESKLWDEIAENLTQLGELNDVEFKVSLREVEDSLGKYQVDENRFASHTAGMSDAQKDSASRKVSKRTIDSMGRANDAAAFKSRKTGGKANRKYEKEIRKSIPSDTPNRNKTGRGQPVQYRKSADKPESEARFPYGRSKIVQGKGSIKDLKKESVEFFRRFVLEADKKGKGSGTKDACYNKVKASAKVWPSAYASGRLVQCRKKGAANYGKGSD